MAVEALGRPRDCGQGTVEAAFLIPVLFMGMLLMLQPGIILYDRIVMQAAASEACRLLATCTSVTGDMTESCENFVMHRLSAVPAVSCFHVHDDDCTWEIELSGDEDSQTVSVTIRNEVAPLPLIDMGAVLLGIVNDDGNLVVEVSCTQEIQPSWADETGVDASEWVGAWLQ